MYYQQQENPPIKASWWSTAAQESAERALSRKTVSDVGLVVPRLFKQDVVRTKHLVKARGVNGIPSCVPQSFMIERERLFQPLFHSAQRDPASVYQIMYCRAASLRYLRILPTIKTKPKRLHRCQSVSQSVSQSSTPTRMYMRTGERGARTPGEEVK